MLGMLRSQKVVDLSPTVQGRLFNNKVPISSRKIMRCAIYGGEKYVDEALTDVNGYFSFTERAIKSSLPNSIFHEPNVQLYITTKFDENVYLIWFSNQDGTLLNEQYSAYLNSLNGDIVENEQSFWTSDDRASDKSYQIHSICRW
ncbi:hypothetical protein FLM48_17130 [Shewanella sp. Scap07]|uniref:DUF6795 domain-containing protein n=1 Tax=Shewanella sp. Scap07 TaxID=2589987 RepID=UPI0015BA2936|nr:DUF6795 domain-containing protein [Shewanella sp. Scap07]QLE86643.1 hypothetical protein FLM48_17130 [Shewanella sp. Scap07]